MQISPLDAWTASQIGLACSEELSIAALRTCQLKRLKETLRHAVSNSPFYRERLVGVPPCHSLDDLKELPFTTARDIVEQGLQMVAVSQGGIERVVTLQSSGTTGQPKRLYFTRLDLQRTQDFFRCGMSQVLKSGDRVLVFLPGELPDSQGRLLAEALKVHGIDSDVYGLITDPEDAAELLGKRAYNCVVGIPIQILSVIRQPAAVHPRGRIGSVFLTSDYVPSVLVEEIARTWGCPAFNHYGMTELGLTGGVECQALAGYHLREPDFFFEVIDPLTGLNLPPGELGEVVVTTLARTGMPLIRYRTGDLARYISDPCPCGSRLTRMSKLQGRLAGQIDIGGPLTVSMPQLDEALFSLPDLLNFRAALVPLDSGKTGLQLTIETRRGAEQRTRVSVDRRLPTIPALRAAMAGGVLTLRPTTFAKEPFAVSATIKRTIEKSEKEYVSVETTC
jgi:phenylacetate-coenzyme A ligase PaaK-like adenylate-forming protein